MGVFTLPDGYAEIKCVNLQKDKKLAVLINIGAAAMIIALFFVGNMFVPFSFTITNDNFLFVLLNLLGLLFANLLYLLAHEFVHGIFIKRYSGKKAKYGFTGLYAYAGSDAYFNKRQYIVIALAPVVLFGVIFLLLNLFLSKEWFWWIFFLQMLNLSGAAGDFYITWLMSRLPVDVLTTDKGVSMIMYSRIK